jgi:hypothetical protein
MLAIIVILVGLVVVLGGGFVIYASYQSNDEFGIIGILIGIVIFGIGVALVLDPIFGWVEAADAKSNYDTYVEYMENTKARIDADEAALRAECVEWLEDNKNMTVDDSVSLDSMLFYIPELEILLGQKLNDHEELMYEYNRIQEKVSNVNDASFDKVFYWPW